MALTPQAVLTRAGDLIQDATNVRWPIEELLRYLNDGRREVAIARPDLYAKSAVVTLVNGTKQEVPAEASRLIDAVRNVNVDSSPGRAVRIVEREVLDAQRPDWHSEATGPVKHFMFDERTPKVFYVYPPAVSGAKLEIAYSQSPQELLVANIATDQLTAEDIYTGALVDYVCYRAFSKDAEYAGNQQRALSHYQQFSNALGIGVRSTVAVSPNVSNVGGVPPRAAQGV